MMTGVEIVPDDACVNDCWPMLLVFNEDMRGGELLVLP